MFEVTLFDTTIEGGDLADPVNGGVEMGTFDWDAVPVIGLRYEEFEVVWVRPYEGLDDAYDVGITWVDAE